MARMTKQKKAEELARRLEYELNYDPLEELVKLAKHSRTNSAVKKQIAVDLMPYKYPKLKAVEVDQSGGKPVIMNFAMPADHPTIAEMQEED